MDGLEIPFEWGARFDRATARKSVVSACMDTSTDLTRDIVAAALEVHSVLGCGLDESAYEQALAHELGLRGLRTARQVAIVCRYRDVEVLRDLRADLVVQDEVVVDVMCAPHIEDVRVAHVLTCLRFSGLGAGLILNFWDISLETGIRHVISDDPPASDCTAD